jgi:predicted phosphohydrolase
MRVFAIGDLHLPSLRAKEMDRFGWNGHPAPLAAAWDAAVADDDLVLLVGDLSWATRSAEAVPDFTWIEQRRGKKVLLKGNHDHWWGSSLPKMQSFLEPFPSVIGLLHASNNTLTRPVRVGRLIVAGTRGWTALEAPSMPAVGEMGAETFRSDLVEREQVRLDGSLAEANRLVAETPDAIKLVAMHFPPRYSNGRDTGFSKSIEAFQPVACVYGHLHGPGIAAGFVGERGGVPYQLVSCDAAKFAPAPVRRLDGSQLVV